MKTKMILIIAITTSKSHQYLITMIRSITQLNKRRTVYDNDSESKRCILF